MKVFQLLLPVLLASFAQTQLVTPWGWKEVVGLAKDPIDKTITTFGNLQCGHVKRLVGVDYDQISGLVEPQLNRLTLNFVSRNVKVSVNLAKAAQSLSSLEGVDPGAKLVIYFHGFLDDPTGFNFRRISDAFLQKGEYNIVGVDASALIRFLYLRSTTCVRFIGERVGKLLVAMVQKGLDPASIHLIGHSLGSHIAGFTGKQLLAVTGSRPGRISGLDPAGPCFANVRPDLRLQKSDADFVDVIHTDGGVFGLTERVGHIDFYPNGGGRQPGCVSQTCSHLRVNELFAESVVNAGAFAAAACAGHPEFKINLCDNHTMVMGVGTPATARGRYYLRTDKHAPYGLGHKGAKHIDWLP